MSLVLPRMNMNNSRCWSIDRVVSVSYDEDDQVVATSTLVLGQKRARETVPSSSSSKVPRPAPKEFPIALHVTDLSEIQCRKLLSTYFGFDSKITVSGKQLFAVNSIADVQSLGLGHLPLAKQRRLIDELQQWRELNNGVLPRAVVDILVNVTASPSPSFKENVPVSTVEEDVYIFVCQGKFLAERIDIGGFQEAMDIGKISPQQLQKVVQECQALDAWSAIAKVVLEHPSFKRLAMLLLSAACPMIAAPSFRGEQIDVLFPVILQMLCQYCTDAKVLTALQKPMKGYSVQAAANNFVQEQHVRSLIASMKYFAVDADMVFVVGDMVKTLPAIACVDTVLLETETVNLLTDILANVQYSHVYCLSVVKLITGILKHVAIKCSECEIISLQHAHLIKRPECDNISCLCSFCQSIGTICTLVVKFLDAFSSNNTVVKHACQLISCLSSSPSLVSNKVGELLHQAGVEGALLSAMKIYRTKHVALLPILAATFSMIVTNIAAKTSFVSAEGMSELVAVLRENKRCPSVIEQTCRIISLVGASQEVMSEILLELIPLCRESLPVVEEVVVATSIYASSALLEAEFFPIVLAVLRDSKSVMTVQRLLNVTKLWLTKHKEEHQKDDAVMMIIPVVMDALQHHGGQSLAVVTEVIAILTNIVQTIPSVSAPAQHQEQIIEQLLILFKATHFFPVMAKIFASRTMDIELVVAVNELLAIVLKKFPQTNTLYDAGKLIMSVITAMIIHKREESVVIAALSVLRITSIPFAMLTERNCQRLVGAFHELLVFHGLNQPVIVNQVCWLIVSLGVPILSQLDLCNNASITKASSTQNSSSPFVRIFMELLTKHIACSETATHLFWVIANISMQKYVVAKMFCEAGIMSLVLQAVLLHSRLPKLMKYVSFTLKGLTSYNELIEGGLLDCSMVYSALEILLPLYFKDKTVMPPLCSVASYMMRFDTEGLKNKTMLFNRSPDYRQCYKCLFQESLAILQAIGNNAACLELRAILSVMSSSPKAHSKK